MRRWWLLALSLGASAILWLPDICKSGRAMLWPILWFSGVDPYLFGLVAGTMELLIALLERNAKQYAQQK